MAEVKQKIRQLNLDFESDSQCEVLCYGHFTVLHPGHFRFLNYAAEQGKSLTVLIAGDEHLGNLGGDVAFDEKTRAEAVASLNMVDHVIIQSCVSLDMAVIAIRPKIFILGHEFEETTNKDVSRAIELVKSKGGRVIFHSGETQYAISGLRQTTSEVENRKRREAYELALKRQKISKDRLNHLVTNVGDVSLLVIGDTILDEYVACDAVGMSAEAPVVVLKELETKRFVGGSAIVARHVNALGAQCHFVSVVGDDMAGREVEDELKREGVLTNLVIDPSRPTTSKTRFMVDTQKLVRVSRLKEHDIAKTIERKILKIIEEKIDKVHGIIISDFVYGCVTQNVLNNIQTMAKHHGVKLYGDLQCSSQVGNVLKFTDFFALFPTEREVRIALGNKSDGVEYLARKVFEASRCENLVFKFGAEGFVCYSKGSRADSREHFSALVSDPVDVSGAGDTLLATMSVFLAGGATLMEAGAIGAQAAGLVVKKLGNMPIEISELRKAIVS